MPRILELILRCEYALMPSLDEASDPTELTDRLRDRLNKSESLDLSLRYSSSSLSEAQSPLLV